MSDTTPLTNDITPKDTTTEKKATGGTSYGVLFFALFAFLLAIAMLIIYFYYKRRDYTQTGDTGPQGPQGITGPANGITGPTGPSGVTGGILNVQELPNEPLTSLSSYYYYNTEASQSGTVNISQDPNFTSGNFFYIDNSNSQQGLEVISTYYTNQGQLLNVNIPIAANCIFFNTGGITGATASNVSFQLLPFSSAASSLDSRETKVPEMRERKGYTSIF